MRWLTPERTAPPRGRRLRSLRLLPVAMVVILLAGCAPKVLPDGRIVAQDSLGRQVLDQWQARTERFHALQGLAKVKLDSPSGSGGASQVLIARKPARLRAETLGLFGTTLMMLATDGRRFEVWVPPKNRYYEGRASAVNMGRFIHIPVTPDLLVDALLYDVPIPDYVDLNAWQLTSGGWLIELTGWDWRQALKFDGLRRLVEVRYFDRGEPVADIRYGDFPEQAPFFPHRIELTLHQEEVEASLDFSDLQLNTRPDATLFQLAPPADVERFDLDRFLPRETRDAGRGTRDVERQKQRQWDAD